MILHLTSQFCGESLTDISFFMSGKKKKIECPSEVSFTYAKSNLFRVIHSDGVIGSLTPKNDLFISFYHERQPLPDKLIYEITEEGTLGKEKEDKRVVSTEGILREMEVGVVIDLNFARNLSLWLTKIIQQAEEGEGIADIVKGE